jgi:hypothetical protein
MARTAANVLPSVVLAGLGEKVFFGEEWLFF